MLWGGDMFKRSITALTFLFAIAIIPIIVTGAGAADGQKLKELNQRIKYWTTGKVLPFCTFKGGKPFPSKFYPNDNRDNQTGKCDDGDSIMFNALLCSVGEKQGCAAVKASQDGSGRWWRSPRKAKERAPEGGSETTFSTDHAVGVMIYALATKDKKALDDWIKYLNTFRQVGVLPAFCKDTRCIAKPIDCPLLDRTAAMLTLPNLLCAPNPYPPSKAIAELVKLHEQVNEMYNDLPAKEAVAPGFKQLNNVVIKLLDQARQVSAAIEYEAERGATIARTTNGLASVVALLNSEINKPGYSRNNVSVAAYLLLKYGGFNGPEISLAASNVARKEPQNAFLEYVANGPTDKMLDIILQKCPSKANDKLAPRHQWTWERADQEMAHRQTMYWDCLFVAKLYKSGPIKGSHATFAFNDAVLKKLTNKQAALEQRIMDTIELLKDLLELKPLKDPVQFAKKFVEKKLNDKVEKLKKRVNDPIGSAAEDILNPGGLFSR